MSNIPGDTRPEVRPAKRSNAWIYYTVLAVLSLVAVPSSHGVSLIATALLSAYAVYLYRGGSIVVWFW